MLQCDKSNQPHNLQLFGLLDSTYHPDMKYIRLMKLVLLLRQLCKFHVDTVKAQNDRSDNNDEEDKVEAQLC